MSMICMIWCNMQVQVRITTLHTLKVAFSRCHSHICHTKTNDADKHCSAAFFCTGDAQYNFLHNFVRAKACCATTCTYRIDR